MFGDLVRTHRRRHGLTQEELAQRTCINVRTIGKLEANSIAGPRSATVRLLADAFGLAGAERDRFFDAATPIPAAGPLPTVRLTPAQLPDDGPDFVDWTEQLDVFTAALDRDDASGVILITPNGAGGVAPSALAIRWAHAARSRFPDGQLWVNLRGYDPDPMPIPDALAGFLRALGLDADAIPSTVDERSAVYRSLLAGRRLLVLVDNASSAEQVRPLLPGTAGCVAVVTSRDSLGGLVAREGALRVVLDRPPVSQPSPGVTESALAVHVAARDEARHRGDAAAEARALVCLGIEYGRRSAVREAERYLVEGIEVARRAGDLVTEGMGLGGLAVISGRRGRSAQAARLLALVAG